MKRLLAILVLAAGGLATAQPPEAKQPPAKAPRMHFDAEAGAQVPVITLPDLEKAPVGLMSLQAVAPDWGTTALKVEDAWKVAGKGKGVKVLVLDTGIDYTHPDFGGIPQERMKSFVPGQSVADVLGHGTHCMGRVAGRGTCYGVAPEAEIWVGKVLDNSGSGAVTWIARGIDWGVENNVDVISLSLGGGSTDQYIPPALARAKAKGIIVIAAAGNEGPREGTVGYPGGYPDAFANAAHDRNFKVASFSSRGKPVFGAAPGVQINSQLPGGRYGPMSGTSMSTPHEAGCACLFCGVYAGMDRVARLALYRKKREECSIDLGEPGRDTAYGFGRLDLVKFVSGATKPPPVEPPPVVVPPLPPAPGFSGEVRFVFLNGLLVNVVVTPTPKVNTAPSPKAKSEARPRPHPFKDELLAFMKQANKEYDGNLDLMTRVAGPKDTILNRRAEVGKIRYGAGDSANCWENEEYVGSKKVSAAADWLLVGYTVAPMPRSNGKRQEEAYSPVLPEKAVKYTPETHTQRLSELSSNGGPFLPRIERVPIASMENKDWMQSGGMRGIKDVVSEKFRTGDAAHRKSMVPVKNTFGRFQNALGITRKYPDGTRFDDVLKHKGVVFEHRVREKVNGKWEGSVIYRDKDAYPPGYTGLTVTCASCHDRVGQGEYGRDGLVPGGDTVFSDPIDWSLR
jgi:subtilisin